MTGTISGTLAHEVKSRLDLLEVIQEHVRLKQYGKKWRGLCPFHNDHHPSLTVYPESNRYVCLSGETNVITRAGQKKLVTLAGREEYVIDGNGEWVKVPFYSFGKQSLWAIRLRRNGDTRTIYATAEHEWLVRGYRGRVSTSKLLVGARLEYAPLKSTYNIRNEDFATGVRHGIVFGDGTLPKGRSFSRVTLFPEKFPLAAWFPSVVPTPGKNGENPVLHLFGLPSTYKSLPALDDVTDNYLAGFLAGYFATDGCIDSKGTAMLSSANITNLLYIRDIAWRLGISVLEPRTQMRIGINQTEPSAIHQLVFAAPFDSNLVLREKHLFRLGRTNFSRQRWVVVSVEPTNRIEEVYCAVVPTTHSFVIEGGILTGNCFSCGAQGDVFDWYENYLQQPFVEALPILAQRAGIDVPNIAPESPVIQQARTKLDKQHHYYQTALRQPLGKNCRRYIVQERGITGATATAFGLGYAPTTNQHDPFKGRLIVPIFDEIGHLVGFSGRTMGKQKPKYLNSPHSEIFNKGKILYNLKNAKPHARKLGAIMLMEGFTDVILATQAGFPNCIATMGTALTDDHTKILARLKCKIILCLDSDTAGKVATRRGIERLLSVGNIVQNLYIATIAGGKDPGEAIRHDPKEFAESIERAKPVISWLLEVLTQVLPDDGKARASIVKELVPLIRNITDPIEQDYYCQKIAQAIDCSVDAVRLAVSSYNRQPTPKTPAVHVVDVVPVEAQTLNLEGMLLGMYIQYPAWAKKHYKHTLTVVSCQEATYEQLRQDICTNAEQANEPGDALLALSAAPERKELLTRVLNLVSGDTYAGITTEKEWLEVVQQLCQSLQHHQSRQRQKEILAQIGTLDIHTHREQLAALMHELQTLNVALAPKPSRAFSIKH